MEKTSEADILWQELRQVCEQSIELAQDLGRHLQRGVAGPQLQPLLEESAELVGHLRGGIRNLASRGEKIDSAEREQLLVRMRVLLQLEEQNHAQLGSKGVRLNTPRSYRYNAGSRARQNRPAPTESNRV
ncbi:MAG: hypothetical protein HN780_01130 [Gemmatimonadetes bacterium]|nr:hypothetical protein [Gemmatimonadota bacterium]MBT7584235.1 hypothetical protein [Gemmatimonadota bacterium]